MNCEIFISAKTTDAHGNPTPESELAREVHDYLTSRGLTVFLSTLSLAKLGIDAYKKAIDDALDAARVLIAIGTSAENLESEWVRYEWDSFFTDVLSGVKPEGHVFVYVDGIPIALLPRALRQRQVFFHGPDSLEELSNFVCNALGRPASALPGRAEDARQAELNERSIQSQIRHRVTVDFTHEAGGFWTGANEACRAEQTPDGYHLTINKGKWYAVWSSRAVASPDLILTVDVTKVAGPNGHGFGVVLRPTEQPGSTDEQDWQTFCIWSSGRCGYTLLKGPKGRALYNFRGTRACPSVARGNARNEIKLIWKGTALHCLAGGVHVFTVRDLVPLEVAVGFVAVSELQLRFHHLNLLSVGVC